MKNLRKPEEIIINGVSLKELLKSHKKWLDNEETGEQLILRYANLEGVNLSCADLRYADLENTDLKYTNLKDADLRRTDLEGANLSCADLSYANLKGVNLEDVDLRRTDLEGANLSCADLSYANLKGVNLRYTNLSNTNLENANLKNAKFYLTELYKVKRKDLFGVSNIGSRYDTIYYFIEDNRIIYECFDNTLENFEEKVKDTYDKNSKEYVEYMIAIDTFKRYKEMYYKRK